MLRIAHKNGAENEVLNTNMYGVHLSKVYVLSVVRMAH